MRVCRGSLKGREVAVSEKPGLRPTQTKVREALWSILEFGEKGAFVDLFAGTGLVAVEACSNGFAPVYAVEKDPGLFGNIQALQRKFDLPLTVFHEDVHRQLIVWSRDGRTFPLLFADPPYAYDRLDKLLEQALAVLAPGGTFILESQKPFPLEEKAERVRAYGKTVLGFFNR
jgi:16S rRNA (guanine(966)-N(2))-methyltransferase RsmD